MTHDGRLARIRSIQRDRKLDAGRKGGWRPVAGTPVEFPVFGDRQKREFDVSSQPMRITEHDTLRYLAVNDAAVKLYGYTREEFLRLTILQTRHPEEHEQLIASFAAPTGYLRYGPPRRQVKKSGEIILAEVVTQDILFNGRKARLSLTIDVTERKEIERALHESESKYRGLVESSSDVIWATDAEGRLTFINDAVRRIYGYEPGEMLGRSVSELLGAGQWRKSFGFFRRMLSAGRSITDYECEVRDKDGDRVVLSSNAIVLRDAEGKRIGVTGISKDITARKRAEQALREKSEFLQKMIESSRDCIKVLDLEGRLLWISAAGQRLMEIDEPLSLLGKSYLDFWEGAEREIASKALVTARAGEANWFEGYCPTTKGVPKWWNEIVTPILGDDGSPEKLLVVSRDITEHRRAEEERMKHALLQRDALVREVHHRIKNNLQGVAGLLRRKINKRSTVAPEIEEVIAQLQSVALVYGLQETRPDGLLDLADVTDAICNSAESLIGGRVERIFERGSRQPACVAGSEAVSVAVALNELVVNALKHQPAEAGEKHARVRVREGKDAAEIRISNRGSLPKSFDFAAGRAVGNGLGLVRTLLASPGGNLVFSDGRDRVEVVLTLTRPLLAERDVAHAE